MRHERLVRYAAVSLVVFLGIAYLLLSFPAGREDRARLLDFSEFYAAGDIVRQGLGRSLYDLRVQAEFQLQVAPVHAFYLRPPFEALLFVPLTYLSYRSAYAVWVVLSLAAVFIAAKLIRNNTNVLGALTLYTRGIPVDFGLLVVIFLSFAPTMNCFLIGQDSVFMLLVDTLVFVTLQQRREFAAGAMLACGLFKFHLVIPFAIIFLLRRRGSFLFGFSLVALLLVVVSMLVSGPGVIITYPKMFLSSDYRRLMNFQPEYAANIRGFVYLITAGKFPVMSGLLVAALSVVLIWTTAKLWNESERELSFCAAIIAALLTGVHCFVYDLCLLLLPVSIICSQLTKSNHFLGNIVLNTALLLLFIPPIHHLLITYHVYALMCLPIVALYWVAIRTRVRNPSVV